MTPIPLSAPDGRVYAYACGRCHHVNAGASVARFRRRGPIRQLVEASLIGAESCCVCRQCGKASDSGSQCEACWKWWAFCVAWGHIGVAMVQNITTAEAWDDLMRGVFEDDDD